MDWDARTIYNQVASGSVFHIHTRMGQDAPPYLSLHDNVDIYIGGSKLCTMSVISVDQKQATLCGPGLQFDLMPTEHKSSIELGGSDWVVI